MTMAVKIPMLASSARQTLKGLTELWVKTHQLKLWERKLETEFNHTGNNITNNVHEMKPQ